jgi:hypothetical protein
LAEQHDIKMKKGSIYEYAMELAHKRIISANSYLALSALSRVGNMAAHGANVDERSIDWAMDAGSKILQAIKQIK